MYLLTRVLFLEKSKFAAPQWLKSSHGPRRLACRRDKAQTWISSLPLAWPIALAGALTTFSIALLAPLAVAPPAPATTAATASTALVGAAAAAAAARAPPMLRHPHAPPRWTLSKSRSYCLSRAQGHSRSCKEKMKHKRAAVPPLPMAAAAAAAGSLAQIFVDILHPPRGGFRTKSKSTTQSCSCRKRMKISWTLGMTTPCCDWTAQGPVRLIQCWTRNLNISAPSPSRTCPA